MKKKTKRPITVVELLIVLMLLGVFAGLLGFSLTNLKSREMFQQEASRLLKVLQTTEEMMLLNKDNLQVEFTEKENQLHLEITHDNPQTGPLLRKKSSYKTLKATLTNELGETRRPPFTLKFSTLYQSIPRGTLTLTNVKDKEQKKEIVMNGYPHPLSFGKKGRVEIPAHELYPEKIRSEYEKED